MTYEIRRKGEKWQSVTEQEYLDYVHLLRTEYMRTAGYLNFSDYRDAYARTEDDGR